MRVVSTFAVLLLCIVTALAQGTKLEWAKHNSGLGTSTALDMVVNDSGYVHLTGYFTDTVDFDPGPDTLLLASTGDKDIFVQKLSPAGDLVWAKRIGGVGADEATAIALDSLNNVYLTGTFTGTVDFNPGAATNNLNSSGGSVDVFAMRLTAVGNYSWANRTGNANNEMANDLAVDATGAVYITGAFTGTVDFNPGGGTANLISESITFSDIFVQKLSTTGGYVWAKRVGGTDIDVANSIALDKLNNVYVTGYFGAFADFDPGAGFDTLFASPSRDVFILKLTSAGNYVWAKQLNGSLFASQGKEIAIDSAQNIYLTGFFVATVDFDPGPDSAYLTPAGGSDPFVLKLDSTGAYRWARHFPGITSNQGLAIAVDGEGSVFTTGYFSTTVDFDPGADNFNLSTTNAASNVYVHKLDSTGQLVWARSVGGLGADRGEAIAVDTLGNVYFAGSFSQTVDFDPSASIFELVADTNTNIFVAKWSPCTITYATIDTSVCYSFTSTAGQVYTTTGTYRETFTNSLGCDSLVTINLTVIDTAYETITQAACDSFTLNGQTYTTSGTYTQLFNSTAGCDSVLTLQLTIDTITAAVTQAGDTLTSTNTGATYQWLDCNGFRLIANATDPIFVPTASGDYAVAVTANGCTDTSACFNVVIIGIAEAFGQPFALYPNPTTGKVSIDLGETHSEVQVTVTTLAGQLISTAHYTHTSAVELTLHAPAGLYLVTLTSPQGQRVMKVVKE